MKDQPFYDVVQRHDRQLRSLGFAGLRGMYRSEHVPPPKRRYSFERPTVTLPDPLAWYRADDISAAHDDVITSWPDASGNGYDLPGAGRFVTNALNGLPGVETRHRTTSGGGSRGFEAFHALGEHEHLTILSVYTGVNIGSTSSAFLGYLGSDVFGEGYGELQLYTDAQTEIAGYASVDDGSVVHESFPAGIPNDNLGAHWAWVSRSPDGTAIALDGGTEVTSSATLPTPHNVEFVSLGDPGAASSTNTNRDYDILTHEMVVYPGEFTPAMYALLAPYVNDRWGL